MLCRTADKGPLGLDQTHDQAASEFLQHLGLSSYLGFEERLLAMAHDALRGTGWRLDFRRPGVDILPEAASVS